jgi:hypothetical protein
MVLLLRRFESADNYSKCPNHPEKKRLRCHDAPWMNAGKEGGNCTKHGVQVHILYLNLKSEKRIFLLKNVNIYSFLFKIVPGMLRLGIVFGCIPSTAVLE